MEGWRKTEKYYRYPYWVSKEHTGKWRVTWSHKTAGVSHQLVGEFETTEDAMNFANTHGQSKDWEPCTSENYE